MNRMDEELRKALGRVEAPAGFADRVLAAARQREEARRRSWAASWLWRPARIWAAAAVAACLLVWSGVEYRQRRQAEQAKAQLMLAMRIAGSRFNSVQAKAYGFGNARTRIPAGAPAGSSSGLLQNQ